MTDSLAIYIHWPFCATKCPYCDFNSHVRAAVDDSAWRAALLADLRYEATLLSGRRVGSIFFGGGTPSLMPPATVAALIAETADLWVLDSDCEITLEANPDSASKDLLADFASAGVNRLSIGVQSLDERVLAFLGRVHDAAQARQAITNAQRFFPRVSFDLIYARPHQSLTAWQAELSEALAFGTSHVSLYQLTIEPGTRFATRAARGEKLTLDDSQAADLFTATREQCAAAGLPAYEISNHARAGAESRHNLAYWRYNDYVGIGPGAHGRRCGEASLRHKKPENWLAAVERNSHGLTNAPPLTAQNRASEALLMGLRLAEGVDLARIETHSTLARADFLDLSAVARLEQQGFLTYRGDRLRVCEVGALLLDAIVATIVDCT